MFFFSRLQLIYGHRFTVQWPDENTVKLARREWAGRIDQLSWEQLEQALDRAKGRLLDGDREFYWPDVGRILALGLERRAAAHRVFRPGLPEPDSVKQARREQGRRNMARVWELMGGRHAQ